MKPYTDYSDFLAKLFPGIKVQKLSINADNSCPNRDGTIGTGGCIYCNNASFSPSYCHSPGGIAAQIEEGKKFFRRKYPKMKYLAYFQSYTSTHAPIADLIEAYEDAMNSPDICGLVIGTRPDCMPEELLSRLSRINRTRMPVIVEYGVESVHDSTLDLINRHHTSLCAKETVRRTAAEGISVGIHLIMGLPGETPEQMKQTVLEVCTWPISIIKFHQLQIIKDTKLYSLWEKQNRENQTDTVDFPVITTFTPDTYLQLCCELISIIPSSIAIERFTAQCPPELLAAPRWNLKNYEFTHRLNNLLSKGYSQ
ncbi:MAG: TIGR01212 family radical SAM protein [Prevotella sp.]|nr:TIGR01212 family radical SAM protein [Prevotella sp.]MCM1074743.1 TIGR01212 family radical SAM protein [Ruminococcus sp.]